MAGIGAVGGITNGAQFVAEYGAKVARLQKDALEQQGDLALQLIQSASINPSQGIDIRI
ncbi:MAG: hypothetical protein RLZZ303_1463 [Candidatus Hydrogenedentota bacterium]|jgi:hypothetical protein